LTEYVVNQMALAVSNNHKKITFYNTILMSAQNYKSNLRY